MGTRPDRPTKESFDSLLSVAKLPGCEVAFCTAVADVCERHDDADICSLAGLAITLAVWEAMRSHPASAECQWQGFRASVFLLPKTDAHFVDRYTYDKYFPRFLTSMDGHVQSYDVSYWACAFWHRLGARNRMYINQDSIVERVMAAMDMWDREDLLVDGCGFLADTYQRYPLSSTWGNSGSLAVLLRVLKGWPVSRKVTVAALNAVRNLTIACCRCSCVEEDCRTHEAHNKGVVALSARVLSSGILAPVCAALVAFPTATFCPDSIPNICRSILWNLARTLGKAALQATGLLEEEALRML